MQEHVASLPPAAKPDREHVPSCVLIAAAAMFTVSFFLPFAVHNWRVGPGWMSQVEYTLFWNWSGFGSGRFLRQPGIMIWFWVSSFLLIALSLVSYLGSRWRGRARVLAAWIPFLLYVCVRLTFDRVALSWPCGPEFLRWLFGWYRADDNPFYAIRLHSKPNPAWHYVVVLRVLLSQAAAFLPVSIFLWRRYSIRSWLGEEAWKVYVALLFCMSFLLPFAPRGPGPNVRNWSRLSSFFRGGGPEDWYFWAGSALLLFLAAAWLISWRRGSGSFAVAVSGATAYLVLRAWHDLLSLGEVEHAMLRSPGAFFDYGFWGILRVYLTVLAVVYPFLRTTLERLRVTDRPKASNMVLYGVASALGTWVTVVAKVCSGVRHTGDPVSLLRAWGSPAVYALVAPLPAIAMYLLLFSAGKVLASRGFHPTRADVAARVAAILWSAALIPLIMCSLFGHY